ncbi:hypothetical protein [Streptomyces sp. NPDC059063]
MRLPTSYVPRPMSMAPVAAMTSGNVTDVMRSKIQSIVWPDRR